MSDETKTKLEGDDLLEFELDNVFQAARRLPLFSERAWARGHHETRRIGARAVLAWARARLVAPAFMNARKPLLEELSILEKERDELRAKVAELEAKLAAPAPAALPKVGETVEVRVEGLWTTGTVRDHIEPHSFHVRIHFGNPWWCIRFMVDEGKTWRRVQPQPSESAPEAATVEPTYVPSTSEPTVERQAKVVEYLEGGKPTGIFGAVVDRECEEGSFWTVPPNGPDVKVRLKDEGKFWRWASQPHPSAPSEPPPEDVATPALDKVKRYSWDLCGMADDKTGIWTFCGEAKAAYRRDLAAAIARATEQLRARLGTAEHLAKEANKLAVDYLSEADRLRKENAELREAERARVATPKAGETWSQVLDRLDKEALALRNHYVINHCPPYSPGEWEKDRTRESWQKVAWLAREMFGDARLRAENDDLRRQLAQYAGECAACGESFELVPRNACWGEHLICHRCSETKKAYEVDAAIGARRAGK